MPLSWGHLNPLRLIGIGRPPDSPPTPAQVEANIRHMIWDVAWFGVLWGSLVAYLQVYVVRLGASSLLVSAITYGPALVGIFWQIPAARLITRSGHRMGWLIGGGFAYRLLFLAVALVPFLAANGRAELTALLWVATAIPSAISNVAFISMMADALPAERMTQVVGVRMAAFGVANTLTTLAGGQLLGRIPFPLNYQVLFLIGYAGAMASWWHLRQLHVPDREGEHAGQPAVWREVRRALAYPRYGHYVLGVGAVQLALGMIAPLLPLYWVRRLGATDGQVSLVLTVASASFVLGSLLVRRAAARMGRERALAAGALAYALYPLLTSLSPSVWWLAAWAAVAGVFNAAITVTLLDNLFSVTPAADRTTYIALYNVAANIALFVGPILAGLLAANNEGIVTGLRVATVVGLIAGAILAARRAPLHAHGD